MQATLNSPAFADALGENPYPSDATLAGDDLRRIDYIPTPREIAKACASIRSRWTLSEKRRRYVGEVMPDEPETGWSPPVIDTSHFRVATGRADVNG